MIVEKFERMHPAHHEKTTGAETGPVVILQMPPCPDERRFFVRILNAVGAPYNPYWRVDALEHAALNALALIHAQVLVIDKVHQLLAGSAREQRLSLNLIKSISNDLRISIVAVRTGDLRHAIETDSQIRRRFDPFALPRWTKSEEFRDVVCAFGKLYPLRKVSEIGERSLVQRLLHASEGITGPVARLWSLAAGVAIRSSAERIDEAAIELVASRLEKDAS